MDLIKPKNAILACLCMCLYDDFDFPLCATKYKLYYFRLLAYTHLVSQTMFYVKNIAFWEKIFANLGVYVSLYCRFSLLRPT